MSLRTGEEVSWASLPRKDQLFILCLMRFAEPVVGASIGTFVYFQLKSLDSSISSAEIIRQVSYLNSAFTLSQCFSILLLGKLADSPRGGRKLVLLMGTGGSIVSCVAFGFVKSFPQALALRIFEGAFNGNMATIKTMVSEVVVEKRFQARAFVLLPMSFNLAVMVSPLMAGQLADLADKYPEKLSQFKFLKLHPYAPPALMNGCILLVAFIAVFFFLEETLEPLKGRYDVGIAISRKISSLLWDSSTKYSRIVSDVMAEEMEPMVGSEQAETPENEQSPKRPISLPFRRIWTRSLCLTLCSNTLLVSHTAAYNTLWPSFLATQVASVEEQQQIKLPFLFSGGAGMSTDDIGWTLAILGIVSFPAQLFAYPRVQQRLGTLRVLHVFLSGFPFVYFIIPYIAVMPSSTPPPAGKHGWPVWALVVLVQSGLMLCSVFVIPSHTILVNGASPHPSALGRTHSIAFLLSSLFRAASASLVGLVLSYGSSHNLIGLGWWCASAVALCGYGVSWLCKEGDGHEVWLEGDAEP